MIPLISLNWRAHFDNHGTGGTAYGFHRHRCEQVRNQATDEQNL